MKKKAFILIIVLIFISGIYLLQSRNKYEKNRNTLTLYGNVDIRDVSLSFRVSGRISEMRFEEGDSVKVGDVIAVLDKVPFEEELAVARAELAASSANLLKYNVGFQPEEINQARARLAEEQARLQNARLIYERRKTLFKKGVVSRQDYDNASADKNEAQARVDNAKEALELAVSGFRKEDIKRASAEYDVAAAKLDRAKTRLNDTEIVSPSRGTILTRVREPGSIVAAGETVYTLSLEDPVWVRTYIDEPDLGKIYPGQKALVYTDTRPNTPYTAQIGFISPQAEFTPKIVETKQLRTDLVYRIRVIVNNPDRGLRQGMPVTIRIRMEKSQDLYNGE